MKPFKISGEVFAEIIRWTDGHLEISVDSFYFDKLTPQQARRLAAWLLKAADYVAEKNKKGKQK